MRFANMRFLLRWGVFYNLELVVLQALMPRRHRRGAGEQSPIAETAGISASRSNRDTTAAARVPPAPSTSGLLSLTPAVPSELRALDRRRRQAQREIQQITRPYGESLCAKCGLCCQEPVNRFTAFDHLIQIGAPVCAVDRYDGQILSLSWIVWNTIKHSAYRVVIPKAKRRTPEPCRHLGSRGCSLPQEDRPMLCASWFCPKYMLAMSRQDIQAVEPRLREIERLHRRALSLARSAAR